MKVSLERTDDAFQMKAQNSFGHEVVMDASEQAGGQGSGVSPMEMVLMAVGGCSSIDIIDILKKQQIPIADLNVDIEAERAPNVPKVFTQIQVTYHMTGNVPAHKALRAVNLSMDKYCSVSKMIEKTAQITWRVLLNGEEISD